MKDQIVELLSNPNISNRDYAVMLKRINRAAQKAYFTRFTQVVEDNPGIVITTPGSDGRAEKASIQASPAEFVVYYDALSQDPERIVGEIRSLCGDIERIVEMKKFSAPDFLYSFEQLRPERLIDSYAPALNPKQKNRF